MENEEYNSPRDLKENDHIVLKKSRSGYSSADGRILRITGVTSGSMGVYYCVSTQGGTDTITGAIVYAGYNGKTDEFKKATRDERARELETELEHKEEMCKRLRSEVEFLKKYKTEEEYLASKIDKLLKTKGVDAKAEILKEMRKSNYL